MQSISFTAMSQVTPIFLVKPLREVFRFQAAELPVAIGIKQLIDRIADDEILFDVRGVPAVGQVGVGSR